MIHDSERQREREQMVRDQILARGITDKRVIEAMRQVPRHRFLSTESNNSALAYADGAQEIAARQTISQPYIVAMMTQSLALRGDEHVLEIGAGSGYQSALLALLCQGVIAIERHEALAMQAQATLAALEITNVQILIGDGSRGVPEYAPYDAILIAAAAPAPPPPLLEQLAPGGRMVLPVGLEGQIQRLQLLSKAFDGSISVHTLADVAFVPLVGTHGFGLPDDLGDMDV